MLRSLRSLKSLRRAPSAMLRSLTTGETQKECRDDPIKQEGERRLVPMPKRTGVSALVPRAYFSTQTAASVSERVVVSVDWLHTNLKEPGLKVLDASWYKRDEQRHPIQEYQDAHIPGALFFDIDGISDRATKLPHMLPSEEAFAAAVSALGIENKDTVVVYDGKGFYSAARVLWMFRVFGHDRVCVLDGGLPRWRASGYAVESSASGHGLLKTAAAIVAAEKVYKGQPVGPTTFQTKFQPHLIWNLEQMLDASGTVLSAEDLKKFFGAGISLDSRIVSGCGTGVTAGTLSLGARSHFILSYARFEVAGTYVSADAAFVLKISNPQKAAEIAKVKALDSAETVDLGFKNAFDNVVKTLSEKSKFVCTLDNTELANRKLKAEAIGVWSFMVLNALI